jgi:hypothetical protein
MTVPSAAGIARRAGVAILAWVGIGARNAAHVRETGIGRAGIEVVADDQRSGMTRTTGACIVEGTQVAVIARLGIVERLTAGYRITDIVRADVAIVAVDDVT